MIALSLLEQRAPKIAALLAMPAARQLIRYVFAGLCVTQFAALVYSSLVWFGRVDALLANVMSTSCALGSAISSIVAGASRPARRAASTGRSGAFCLRRCSRS
jgi:hypothetical protein